MVILFVSIKGQDTVKVGAVFHLTGSGSFWGETEKNAALLAVDEINLSGGINGKPLELVVEDSQTDFTQTTKAFKKLIELDELDLIVGPTWFGQVVSPIAEETKTTIISQSAGVVPMPSYYFFTVWPTESGETKALADYFQDQNVGEVLIVYSLNDWSESITKNFEKFAKEKEIKIVEKIATAPDEVDFKTVVQKIKQISPEAVYAPLAFYPNFGEFVKQYKQAGVNIPLYSSTNTENPVLKELFSEIEGIIYPYPKKSSDEQKFINKYLDKFGNYPAPSAAHAYDSIYLAKLALENEDTNYAKFLHDISYNGISNDNIQFDENGRITEKEHIMKIVTKEGFEELN